MTFEECAPRRRERTMMGNQEHDYPRRRAILLDDLVPADSFYRRLEQRLDLSFVRRYLPANRAMIGAASFTEPPAIVK